MSTHFRSDRRYASYWLGFAIVLSFYRWFRIMWPLNETIHSVTFLMIFRHAYLLDNPEVKKSIILVNETVQFVRGSFISENWGNFTHFIYLVLQYASVNDSA